MNWIGIELKDSESNLNLNWIELKNPESNSFFQLEVELNWIERNELIQALCVALVFNKINHWTTGTLCDIMEKKNIVWKLVFMHLSIVGKLTSRMNCI